MLNLLLKMGYGNFRKDAEMWSVKWATVEWMGLFKRINLG